MYIYSRKSQRCRPQRNILDLRKEQNISLAFGVVAYRTQTFKHLCDGYNALTIAQILNYTPSTAEILQQCFGASSKEGIAVSRNYNKEFSATKFYTQQSVCYLIMVVMHGAHVPWISIVLGAQFSLPADETQ